jgi:hypothetical protein
MAHDELSGLRKLSKDVGDFLKRIEAPKVDHTFDMGIINFNTGDFYSCADTNYPSKSACDGFKEAKKLRGDVE